MVSFFHGGTLAAPGARRRAWLDSLLIDHALLRLVWTNAGIVVPGVLYRSNHPTPGRLAAMARRWKLKSVLNLRGVTTTGSYALSREQALRLGLEVIDLPLSSGHAPSRETLEHLVAVLAHLPAPALMHCKSGADRTGFAAAIYLLVQGTPPAVARRQLSWRWGHLARSRAGVLDAVLDAFARRADPAQDFAHWAHSSYDPEAATAAFKTGWGARLVQERLLGRE